MTYPEPIGRQLDRCDRCGKKVHRKDLIRTQMTYAKPIGENKLKYSYYDGTFWVPDSILTPTVLSSSYTSIGPYGDKSRVRIDSSNTLTDINGSTTFSNATNNPSQILTAESVDGSSWTSLVFSAIVGPSHINYADCSLSVDIGICTDDGTDLDHTTWSLDGMQRIWYYTTASNAESKSATLSALYFYLTATTSGGSKWFAEDMQVESNATKPGEFIRTSGSVISTSSPTSATVFEKLCDQCRKVTILTDDTQTIPQGHEPTVPTYQQET